MKPFDDPERVQARNPICIRGLANLVTEATSLQRTAEERCRSLAAFLDLIEIPLRDLYDAAPGCKHVFEPVASKREFWPVLMTLHPGQHDHVRDTLNSIGLAKCSPISYQCKTNRGPQLWKWSSDRNQVAKGWLDWALSNKRFNVPPFAELPGLNYFTARKWAKITYKEMARATAKWKAPDSPLCSPDDFTDLPSLCAKLKTPSRPFDKWLLDQCSPETKAALETYRDAKCDPLKVPRGLLAVFHRIVRGSSFYDAKRFRGIALRPETKALLSEKREGKELVRLHWLLLEDAYPKELTRERYYPGYAFIRRQFALFDKPSAKGKSKAKRENAAISSLEKCFQALASD